MPAATLIEGVAAALSRHIKSGDHLTVGLSGGLDSVAALSLLRQLQGRLDFELTAHHVNHQISPNASAWATFCADLCAKYAIPFRHTTVNVQRDDGKGLEAAARDARYAVFRGLDADFVVLGHHQDDQAETLLLRLFRGAGVKGMGAMAECAPLGQGESPNALSPPRILRPLLHSPRSDLMDFARSEGLAWIDDESNEDTRYTRNYLRAKLLPCIEERFPAYRSVLDRAAAQFAEAGRLLDDLAAQDAQDALRGGKIAVEALLKVDEARARNLLRYFLGRQGLKMPDHDRLREMLRQVTKGRVDGAICIAHDGVELRRFRGWLHVVHPRTLPPADFRLRWEGELSWMVPALHGTLTFQPVVGEGIARAALLKGEVSIRLRQGGEKLRIGVNRPRRTVKNWLQAAALPPWERELLPLIYIGDELACAPGVGVDVMFQAQAGAEGMVVTWEPWDRV